MSVEKHDFLEIVILNKRYFVPSEATVMQAIEYAGYQFTVRGCGCRGGVCGACACVFRLPDQVELVTGLACQTKVIEGMQVLQMPFFPVNKTSYQLEELEATNAQVMELYPDIAKCMGCNTCTKSCPMDINVMETMADILKGNIEKVSADTVGCTMCGLCATRCPVGLTPYLYTMLCRRLDGRHIKKAFIDIPPRIKEIEEGKYAEELDQLMEITHEELKVLYTEAQNDKRII